MAHKKGQGSSRNGRDSNGQRRGVKRYGGESVEAGNILVRQVGTVIHPGVHVGMAYGNSRTAVAVSLGTVFFLLLGVATSMRIMVSFSGSFQM